MIGSLEIAPEESCTFTSTFCKNCCLAMIFKEIPKKRKLQSSVLKVIKPCSPAWILALESGPQKAQFLSKTYFTYQVRLYKLFLFFLSFFIYEMGVPIITQCRKEYSLDLFYVLVAQFRCTQNQKC